MDVYDSGTMMGSSTPVKDPPRLKGADGRPSHTQESTVDAKEVRGSGSRRCTSVPAQGGYEYRFPCMLLNTRVIPEKRKSHIPQGTPKTQ